MATSCPWAALRQGEHHREYISSVHLKIYLEEAYPKSTRFLVWVNSKFSSLLPCHEAEESFVCKRAFLNRSDGKRITVLIEKFGGSIRTMFAAFPTSSVPSPRSGWKRFRTEQEEVLGPVISSKTH
jgi:hypothetical protein